MIPAVSDHEFDLLLEKVICLWDDQRKDTVAISHILQTTEAKVAYVLSCYREGCYNDKANEEASETAGTLGERR